MLAFVSCAYGLAFISVRAAYAAGTQVHGTISQDTTWTAGASPYVVTGSVTVTEGVRLAIEPGVVVKFNAYQKMTVNGTLVAEGSESSRIYMTSIKDDSVGGDTNGDGSASSPGRLNWDCLSLSPSSSGSRLDYVVIRFGGYSGSPLKVSTNSHSITRTTLENNGGAAIAPALNVTLNTAGNSAVGNETNGIALPSGTNTQDVILGSDLPYVLGPAITFGSGTTVTVQPGANLKFKWGAGLVVNGTMRVEGSDAWSVVFTSIKDDSAGGDTNGDGSLTSPLKGDWTSVKLGTSSSGTISHAAFRYGCYYNYSTWAPLGIYSSNWQIADCTFEHNNGHAVVAHPDVTLNISGSAAHDNTFSNGIGVRSGRGEAYATSRNVTWRGGDLPYVVNYTLQIRAGTTLTVEPGTVVKFCTGTMLEVRGGLDVCGTKDRPVVFTSIKDDAAGGDTNNDAEASRPQAGDWDTLDVSSGTATANVEHARISYAGSFSGAGVHVWQSSNARLHGCVIRDIRGVGVLSEYYAHTTIEYSDVYKTSSYWVQNTYAYTVMAEKNWWAVDDASSGGGFSGSVDYIPWSDVPYWMSLADARALGLLGLTTLCRYYGDPVNASTGNYYMDTTDLSLAGPGPLLEFKRTYNSQDALQDTPLGHGWVHNYRSCLRFDEEGGITVVYPDGKRIPFAAIDGSFETTAGVRDALSAVTGGYELRSANGQVSEYDNNGWLSRQADRFGIGLDLTHDSEGRVLRVQADDGRYIALDYQGSHLATITDSVGRHVEFSHDTSGNLTAVTAVDGGTSRFVYDSNHQMTEYWRPASDRAFLKLEYADSRVVRQEDARSNVTTFTYEPDLGRTVVTDAGGSSWSEGYGGDYRSTSSTDPLARATRSTYTDDGMLASRTNANGGTFLFGYDASRNVTSTRDAAGHETRSAFDPDNCNLLWSEDAAGSRTTYNYNQSGTRLDSITDPVRTTTFSYYDDGLLRSEQVAGATVSYEYDAGGRIARTTDPLGGTSSYTYDTWGNVASATDAESRTTQNEWDASGHLLSISSPGGQLGAFTYDANGNRTTYTDARSKTTTFTYDPMDNLSRVTLPTDEQWAYEYDANNHLEAVTDPRGHTEAYTYDAAGQLAAFEDALGSRTVYEHDAAGNLSRTVNADGGSVNRSYNADGLLTSLSSPSDQATWTLDYTSTHRLASATNGGGWGYTYTYNPLGWLTDASDTVNGSLPDGFDTRYCFDQAGRVTGIRPAAEGTRTYQYDVAGRLVQLDLPSDPAGADTSFTYDRTGLPLQVWLPDGSVRGICYDDAGKVESLSTTTSSGVLAFEYQRDAAGNITAENGTRYGYDELGRLVSWYDPSSDATTTYSYDGAYNLTGVSVDGVPTDSFSYDAADRISNEGYEYDSNGNLVCDGSLVYEYDSFGRLEVVKDESTEATVATYAYDQLNRRISVTENATTTFFHYDGTSDKVIAETDMNGTITATYAYDAAGDLHSMTRGGDVYYYHTNSHHDVVAMTDHNGQVVNTYRYDPYGRVLSESELVENPYRYASYRHDRTTGLYYLWNRYYDPAVFRFLTRDLRPGELEDPGSMKGYVYCLDNPVNSADRTGLAPDLAPVSQVLSWAIRAADLARRVAESIARGDIPVLPGIIAIAKLTNISLKVYMWQDHQIDDVEFAIEMIGALVTVATLIVGSGGSAGVLLWGGIISLEIEAAKWLYDHGYPLPRVDWAALLAAAEGGGAGLATGGGHPGSGASGKPRVPRSSWRSGVSKSVMW